MAVFYKCEESGGHEVHTWYPFGVDTLDEPFVQRVENTITLVRMGPDVAFVPGEIIWIIEALNRAARNKRQ